MEEKENTALILLLQRNLEVANKELAKAHKRILELTKDKYSGLRYNAQLLQGMVLGLHH